MKRVSMLGCGIDIYSFDEAVVFAKKNRGQVVTINPEMIDCAIKNIHFLNIIKNAELVIPDGVGIQIGLKILGYKTVRIPGIEFARRMLSEFSNEPVALIGAKPDVIEKTVQNLKKDIPILNIVYSHDGYFNDENEILTDVVSKNPKLVLVALGSPKQEEFIFKLKQMLPGALMIGVGGSFDVWSGNIKRAPVLYQKLGLEWLYRTVKEPERFRRIFPSLPLFILKVLKEKWCYVINQ